MINYCGKIFTIASPITKSLMKYNNRGKKLLTFGDK